MIPSPLLSRFDWLTHGFGTRLDSVSQDHMASLKQVHSATVLTAESAGCLGEGDALVTREPGLCVSVRTADCFPILLADARTRTVAAVHAGWRGTVARVAEVALREMRSNPEDVYAAIGPGIGECCFEVGAEVGSYFGLDGAGRVDLADANRRQLLAAGVPEVQIETVRGCTFCDAARFYSYRREKEAAGRMISYIGLH